MSYLRASERPDFMVLKASSKVKVVGTPLPKRGPKNGIPFLEPVESVQQELHFAPTVIAEIMGTMNGAISGILGAGHGKSSPAPVHGY